jgi:hypothetical protein
MRLLFDHGQHRHYRVPQKSPSKPLHPKRQRLDLCAVEWSGRLVIGTATRKVANARSTNTTPSKAESTPVGMLVEAKTPILNSGDFLTATEAVQFAGFSSSNLSLQLNKWKRNREIFAVQHSGEDYLPVYALGADHRPRKEIAQILKVFGDAKYGWGLAFWFAALNSFLDDERPQDVLATDPARVIAAAKDEMAELQRA